MPVATPLPRWDMEVVFPAVDAPELRAARDALHARIAALSETFDRHAIEARASTPLDDAAIAAFEEAVGALNALLEQSQEVGVYLTCLVAADSRDDAAQAALSAWERETLPVRQLSTRLTAWLGSLDAEELIERSQVAAEHAFMVRQAQHEARRLMPAGEEELANELNLTGGNAWDKLYINLTSQLLVPVGGGELPMSEVRNRAYDADRATRRAAYDAELAAWQRTSVPLAAALNSIKGQVLTLARRRGWESPLDEALFQNNIDRTTLDTMLTAAREAFPDFRRYLRAKARALGLPALAWYDLFAPLGGATREWTFDEGRAFIERVFSGYSPQLGAYARRAFDERWIDAEPRSGKEDGAFCIGLRRDESRILANFKPVFNGVSTLAHELGHGYHNAQRARYRPLQRTTPMTLAETASIFCETLIRDAGLRESDPAEQLAILEASLQGSCQVVVDITSRYDFETAVFAARGERELSVEELNAAMLAAQRGTYGDGLADDALHPSMWAAKSHYYSPRRSFYNYPYMFGLLFALGLYAQYEADPERFRASYDDLLASTGLDDAATLAARFGIDIRTPDFWRASLAIVRADIDRFEQLIDVASDEG